MFDFFLNPAPAAHKPAAAQFKQTEARDHHQAGAGPTARAVGVQRCPQEAQHRPERSIELQVVGHLHHAGHARHTHQGRAAQPQVRGPQLAQLAKPGQPQVHHDQAGHAAPPPGGGPQVGPASQPRPARGLIRTGRPTPPGAYITMNRNTRPRYSGQALVSSASSTEASTSSTAPMMGPKKNVAPTRKVNNREPPDPTMLKLSAPVMISKWIVVRPPPMPAKKPAMMNAKKPTPPVSQPMNSTPPTFF